MSDKQFCTIAEYQQITGRSPASASRDIKSGRVPCVKIGKSVLIPCSYFDALEQEAFEALARASKAVN